MNRREARMRPKRVVSHTLGLHSISTMASLPRLGIRHGLVCINARGNRQWHLDRYSESHVADLCPDVFAVLDWDESGDLP